jgi:hypothetical protein
MLSGASKSSPDPGPKLPAVRSAPASPCRSSAPEDGVTSVAAPDRIDAVVPLQLVVPGVAEHRVAVLAAEGLIVPRAAQERVAAGRVREQVPARTSTQRVVILPAVETVYAPGSAQVVVTGKAAGDVGGLCSGESVRPWPRRNAEPEVGGAERDLARDLEEEVGRAVAICVGLDLRLATPGLESHLTRSVEVLPADEVLELGRRASGERRPEVEADHVLAGLEVDKET